MRGVVPTLSWLLLALALILAASAASASNHTADNNTAALDAMPPGAPALSKHQVLDRWGNPFPAPFDGEIGVFILNLAAWAIIAALVILVAAPLLKWVAARTPTDLDQNIIGIITKPVFILIFGYGILQSLEVFTLPAWLDSTLLRLWAVLRVIVIVYVVYRLWHEILLSLGKRVARKTETELDDRLYPLFDKVGGAIILVAGVWFIVASFGINMTFFAAGGALVSLVIAFAAQDTLANFFAGIHLLLDRPFREGDRIELPDQGTWGDVIEIGLRSSRVRTRDNRVVIIPNSVIAGNAVINHSYPDSYYRIETHVGIAYGSDIEKARTTMIEAARGAEGVDPNRPVEALFLEFGDNALIFRVRVWIRSYIDTRRIFDRVHTRLDAALREAGIEIPFPQRVLWMGDSTDKTAVKGPFSAADAPTN